MKLAFVHAALSLTITLAMMVIQTNAQELFEVVEEMEAKQQDEGGIFAGADFTNNAMMTLKGKATKAKTPSPTGPTPAPTLKVKKGKGGKSGKATKATPGFLLTGADPTLEIISCDYSTVEVAGIRAAEIQQGNIIVYVPHVTATCTSCNPLYRKVEYISTSAENAANMLLTTTFITLSEIVMLGLTPDDIALGNEIIEPQFECPHSSNVENNQDPTADNSIGKGREADKVVYDKLPPSPPSGVSLSLLTGSCNSDWLQKNGDGRCTHTNCYVGEDGDPNDCFSCKNKCDNGCGAADSFLNTDGNFGTFDFGPACCNHDFCWSSSTFTKEACDSTFCDATKSQCPPVSFPNTLATMLFPILAPLIFGCDILASLFCFAVSKTGISAQAYKKAREEQVAYESEDICIAECPTTQESGGQGTTVLKINMLRTSGTFPVEYQMYGIPDQLTIEYEMDILYDTGGLVSDYGSASVNFSGSSKIITVTINAPLDGTAWDVYVGCPSP